MIYPWHKPMAVVFSQRVDYGCTAPINTTSDTLKWKVITHDPPILLNCLDKLRLFLVAGNYTERGLSR